MFNAPRRGAGNLSSSAFVSSNTQSESFDPLASSMPTSTSFGEVDPWSSIPASAQGTPQRIGRDDDQLNAEEVSGLMAKVEGVSAREGLNAFLHDPPPVYVTLLDSIIPNAASSIPLSSVHRLLASSRLPASTIEKIIALTSRESSALSRPEFFCALALVALAQSSPSSPVSIEQLSSSLPNLPLPSLSPASPPITRGYSVQPDSGWDSVERDNPPQVNGSDGNLPQSGGLDLEAERGYWKRLEKIEVGLIAEKEGWFLQKYRVESDRRSTEPVSRRYSDFVWLLDCLIKRYPFRLLPALPPKKIGPDAHFLEQRRKALQRFLNMLVNHPVTRDDGALNVFLTEGAFEAWRKRTKVSTDEESASKRLNPAQEMGIPSDLEQRLSRLRDNLPTLLNSYQKLVTIAERSLARLQSANADASRIALSLGTVAESLPRCCYKDDERGCTLCAGVGRGLSNVGESWTKLAEEGDKRVSASSIVMGNIEALKTQRDLYLAFRDLFGRYDKLSKDSVDSLGKKIETRQTKMDSTRKAQKPGWEGEVEKLVAATDNDNTTIRNLLARRVFIRACMWHEMSLVFHSRQAAQTTLGWRLFAQEESTASHVIAEVWDEMAERLKSMPIE
ncbi:hypothetical protein BD324DRAFT_576638 [Kockovaella imperatae]|uniref:Sorting nexin MVP1 n=1 Tax=Kockovaella imperatae TaxID=4999 RepID=A0A1Y1ULW0_9TREE|nr:hypothetical protein BD324DRAFT_576638 [Kockovaella imperatae]ORX39040.1 hypothetical protein BD324DRAFT_576638 [Kockovaella imperatae]